MSILVLGGEQMAFTSIPALREMVVVANRYKVDEEERRGDHQQLVAKHCIVHTKC